jgi:hypothetical protein
VIVLMDQDDDPCVTAIRELFPESLRNLFSSSEPRQAVLFVAFKELESWFLADEEAIRLVTGCQDYAAPGETARGATKTKLRELLRSGDSSARSFNEISFAKQIASSFSPERACNCSQSFAYCWRRFEAVAAVNQKSVP